MNASWVCSQCCKRKDQQQFTCSNGVSWCHLPLSSVMHEAPPIDAVKPFKYRYTALELPPYMRILGHDCSTWRTRGHGLHAGHHCGYRLRPVSQPCACGCHAAQNLVVPTHLSTSLQVCWALHAHPRVWLRLCLSDDLSGCAAAAAAAAAARHWLKQVASDA